MTQRMHYFCDCGDDDCAAQGKSINKHEQPVVLYLVAGHVNRGGQLDESLLPPFVVRLLKQPIARIEMHAACAPRVLARLLAEERPAETAPEPAADLDTLFGDAAAALEQVLVPLPAEAPAAVEPAVSEPAPAVSEPPVVEPLPPEA